MQKYFTDLDINGTVITDKRGAMLSGLPVAYRVAVRLVGETLHTLPSQLRHLVLVNVYDAKRRWLFTVNCGFNLEDNTDGKELGKSAAGW